MTFAALATQALVLGAQDAQAQYTSCALSEREQGPPGDTPAYNLSVAMQNTSCAVAKKVMVAFHRCRREGRAGCAKPVLASWRCTGKRVALAPLGVPRVSLAGFACKSRGRRVRGGYQENAPRCFGAAARDPKRPCVNSTRAVYPGPTTDDPHGLDAGAAGCSDDEASSACVFGAPSASAEGHVAIVGDSHVLHWRAALSPVLQAYTWRGYSLSTGGCFFSEAVRLFSEGCGDWYTGAAAWFSQHPEVSTVFVTANADTPVAVEGGQTSLAIKVDGYKRTFQGLPKTVKRVIVLRDTPASTQPTFDCMWRVVAAGTQRAGQVCPLARSVGLRDDPAVLAASQLNSERYRVIDLTRYFCGARSCYPAVAGARVNGDIWGHMTVTYMRTLGPYLMREVRKLIPWRPAS